MTAQHSKHRETHAQIPEQQGSRPLGITDAQTHPEHWVTEESLAVHRHSDRLLVMCGSEVLAASLTAPGRGRCPECAR